MDSLRSWLARQATWRRWCGMRSWLQLPPQMSVAIALAAGTPWSALGCSVALLEPARRLGRI